MTYRDFTVKFTCTIPHLLSIQKQATYKRHGRAFSGSREFHYLTAQTQCPESDTEKAVVIATSDSLEETVACNNTVLYKSTPPESVRDHVTRAEVRVRMCSSCARLLCLRGLLRLGGKTKESGTRRLGLARQTAVARTKPGGGVYCGALRGMPGPLDSFVPLRVRLWVWYAIVNPR